METRKELDSKIRKLKLELINNLDSNFKPLDLDKDEKLEKELSLLYKERAKIQSKKIDSISTMYLNLYA